MWSKLTHLRFKDNKESAEDIIHALSIGDIKMVGSIGDESIPQQLQVRVMGTPDISNTKC